MGRRVKRKGKVARVNEGLGESDRVIKQGKQSVNGQKREVSREN